MDEMIYGITGSFKETEEAIEGVISIDGVTTTHRVLKASTTDARVALLIMMADAVGFEPVNTIDFEACGVNDSWFKEEE